MKELKPTMREEIANVRQTEQKKQLKYLGSLIIQPGHKLWKYDIKNNRLTEVDHSEYERYAVLGKQGETIIKKKLIRLENHLYCSALNVKNAKKRFIKMLMNIYAKQ